MIHYAQYYSVRELYIRDSQKLYSSQFAFYLTPYWLKQTHTHNNLTVNSLISKPAAVKWHLLNKILDKLDVS